MSTETTDSPQPRRLPHEDPGKRGNRAKMVGWYDPRQLIHTAQQVAVSALFGKHADARMIEALKPDGQSFYDYTGYLKRDSSGKELDDELDPRAPREVIWIDYVADTGDGWDSTYAIAYQIAQPELEVTDGANKYITKRGEVLIFGGDEVYPTASRKDYQQRLVVPYETALPTAPPPHPHVYAIPGNHDWYDSLVSFTRLFCSQRWLGGWRTRQTRSYFALKLPHGWWLIGLDVQLGSDLDDAQVKYLRRAADMMKDSDRVILCNAEPHWIYSRNYNEYDAAVYNESNLAFVEKILKDKAAVFIAGDLHHYRRHAASDGTQKITAGGGGAFLYPTHGQDVKIINEEPIPRPGATGTPRQFVLQKSFPDEHVSKRLCYQNLQFLIRNPLFGVVPALFYLMTAWQMMSDVGHFGLSQFWDALYFSIQDAIRKPNAALWAIAMLGGFWLFTDTHSRLYRFFGGLVHGTSHLFADFLIGWGATYFTVTTLGLAFQSINQLLLAGLIIFSGGWIAGSLIMGLYLLISLNVFKRHPNEAFSSLKIADWKHFLRLKIDAQGLTIYPIGIERVPREWQAQASGKPGPGLIPVGAENTSLKQGTLIEPPIVCRGR